MSTYTKKNSLTVAIALVSCVIGACFSTALQGTTYEVRPEISIPEYRTDAGRAIDAYERLMVRFMDMTEKNFDGIDRDIKFVIRKLDSINSKLQELSVRTAKIEEKLGIKNFSPEITKKPPAKIPSKKEQKESFSPGVK